MRRNANITARRYPPRRRFRSKGAEFRAAFSVIRRVGGLEVGGEVPHGDDLVIRRVGGLEVFDGGTQIVAAVIRRVGGLEAGRRGRRHHRPLSAA